MYTRILLVTVIQNETSPHVLEDMATTNAVNRTFIIAILQIMEMQIRNYKQHNPPALKTLVQQSTKQF